MKITGFLILTLSLFLSSCSKEKDCAYNTSNATATSAEIIYLHNYVDTHNIPALQHASGVYYTIHNQGSGSSPTVCSNIRVNYTGRLLGGGIFDASNGADEFVLGRLVLGWQRTLPVLQAGGSITLYIPPSLGYGSQNVYDSNNNLVIPANSYLQFDIDLLDVQ